MVGDSTTGTLASMGAMAATPGVGWIGLASQVIGMFAGGGEVSAASAGGQASLNTSGTVIGKGNAQGGTLSISNAGNWPWYVWAAGALVGMAIIKKAVK